MTRRNQVVLTLAGMALFASYVVLGADAPPNPYERIVVRNTFALKPVPPPAPPAEPPKPPTPKVTLTGITTILGNKIALLKTQASAKPGEPAKDGSYMLAEGEGQDGIHVLEIDVKGAKAKVDCFGNVQDLELSLKPPSGGTGGPVPGGAPATAGFGPPPIARPSTGGGTPVTLGSPGAKPNLPTRPVRGNVGGVGGQGAVGIPAPTPTYNISPLQGQTSTTPNQTAQPQRQLTPEEEIILIEAQRLANAKNPSFPPGPPTVLTPPDVKEKIMVPPTPPAPGTPGK